MTGGKGDSWIEAGFKEIARSGVEGVRVEVLAKNLGVTKGGFYRRFRDRAALLDGILQSWSAGRTADPAMGPLRRGGGRRGCERRCRAAEECRASLSRDGACARGGRRAGVP